MVPIVSVQSNTFFVPKEVVESALKNSDSYLEYATDLFDAYINPDVALLCTWGDYTNDDVDDGHVRASLPTEAMTVYLGTFHFVLLSALNSKDFLTHQNTAQWLPSITSRQPWVSLH